MPEIVRSYYAIIPAPVRYDEKVSHGAKLLYGEITALCNETGYCWATNSYFSKLYHVTIRTINRWIAELAEQKYITINLKYKSGSKEVEERQISINPMTKMSDPHDKNVPTPMTKMSDPHDKNVTDNNTHINNKYINNKDIVEILDHLNLLTESNYRSSSKKTQNLIKARINEGFTVEDFKKVIDNKVAEWKDNPKMSPYLRPETLFGTKFESYLNQKNNKRDSKDEDPYNGLDPSFFGGD